MDLKLHLLGLFYEPPRTIACTSLQSERRFIVSVTIKSIVAMWHSCGISKQACETRHEESQA